MNQYKQVAYALYPNSWFVWVLIAMVIIASVCGLLIGNTGIVVFIVGFSAAGIGFYAWLYRMWEPSQLVPDMQSTFATVMVTAGLVLWALVSLFILSIDGIAVTRIGISLVAIAIGFWVGFGDRFKLTPILGFGFFLMAILFQPQLESFTTAVWNLKYDRAQPWNGLLSASSVLVGIGLLWAFHGSASRKLERNKNWLIQDAWFFDAELVSARSQSSSLIHRMNSMLNVSATWSPLDASFLGLMVAVISGILFWAEGAKDAVIALQWLSGVVIISVPLFYFMQSLPQNFERLWISGVTSTRVETARAIIKIAGYRALYVLALLAIGLMIQSPKQFVIMSSSLSVLLVAFAISALVIWSAARWYRLLARCSGPVLLGCAVMLTILTMSTLGWWEIFADQATRDQFMGQIESPVALLIALAIAVVSWTFCIHDAPRRLARETSLME